MPTFIRPTLIDLLGTLTSPVDLDVATTAISTPLDLNASGPVAFGLIVVVVSTLYFFPDSAFIVRFQISFYRSTWCHDASLHQDWSGNSVSLEWQGPVEFRYPQDAVRNRTGIPIGVSSAANSWSHQIGSGHCPAIPPTTIEDHLMSLSLAVVSLLSPGPKLIAWIERNLAVEDTCPWGVRTWPCPDLAGVASPSTTVPRWLQVSSLWWPNGARFAFGHFLAGGNEVEQIHAAANGNDGSDPRPVTLHMSSGKDDAAEVMETDLTHL